VSESVRERVFVCISTQTVVLDMGVEQCIAPFSTPRQRSLNKPINRVNN
jgi:hypothetical protein